MAENRDSGKKRVGDARSGPGAGMGCQVNLGKMKARDGVQKNGSWRVWSQFRGPIGQGLGSRPGSRQMVIEHPHSFSLFSQSCTFALTGRRSSRCSGQARGGAQWMPGT